MNFIRALLSSPLKLLGAALLVWLLLLGLWQAYFSVSNPKSAWLDLWVTPDQQGHWYFARGDYLSAAQRFDDPQWQAAAYYAAENFSAAEILWGRQAGSRALFYRGNALAHLERYQEAIDSYELSLQLEPDYLPVKENLELVIALSKQPQEVTDFSGGTGGKLEADEIVFDSADSERMQQATTADVTNSGDMSSEEIQALWMRRLQSKPADFLVLKFRYQLEEAENQ
ncbi:MAG: tetratricopeptide repeat protein [Cellvibrionaceae bacterium]